MTRVTNKVWNEDEMPHIFSIPWSWLAHPWSWDIFSPAEGNLKVVQRRLPMHIIFFSQKTTSPYFSAFVSWGNFLLVCSKVENLRSQSCMLFLETLCEASRPPPKLAANCNCQCGRWGKLLHQVNWILIKFFFCPGSTYILKCGPSSITIQKLNESQTSIMLHTLVL